MTILCKYINVFFLTFCISKSLASLHHEPEDWAKVLNTYVDKNQYEEARNFYFQTKEKLEKDIHKYTFENNNNESLKKLKQSIYLQEAMYKHSEDLFMGDTDLYDRAVARVKIYLNASDYYLNTSKHSFYFEQAKKTYEDFLISYDRELQMFQQLGVHNDHSVFYIQDKKTRLINNFGNHFPQPLGPAQINCCSPLKPTCVPLRNVTHIYVSSNNSSDFSRDGCN